MKSVKLNLPIFSGIQSFFVEDDGSTFWTSASKRWRDKIEDLKRIIKDQEPAEIKCYTPKGAVYGIHGGHISKNGEGFVSDNGNFRIAFDKDLNSGGREPSQYLSHSIIYEICKMPKPVMLPNGKYNDDFVRLQSTYYSDRSIYAVFSNEGDVNIYVHKVDRVSLEIDSLAIVDATVLRPWYCGDEHEGQGIFFDGLDLWIGCCYKSYFWTKHNYRFTVELS